MAAKVKVFNAPDMTTYDVHAIGCASGGDYATLCGMDGYDEACGQYGVAATSEVINCHDCRSIILHAKQYGVRDIAKEMKG